MMTNKINQEELQRKQILITYQLKKLFDNLTQLIALKPDLKISLYVHSIIEILTSININDLPLCIQQIKLIENKIKQIPTNMKRADILC